MKKLIILSDLRGKKNYGWVDNYTAILKKYYEIEFYDSCELANIDSTQSSENELHQQFINGGIKEAVAKLLQSEHKNIDILGFSIGGFISWRAALEGLNVDKITAISSTRLRYESKRPKCEVDLFYGENDNYIPASNWFFSFGLVESIYKNEEHEFYRKDRIATDICSKMIQ